MTALGQLIECITQTLHLDGVMIGVDLVSIITTGSNYIGSERDTLGICDQLAIDKYAIQVVNDDQWRITLAHELYHVYQYVNELEPDCILAEAFAQSPARRMEARQ